MYSKKVGMVNPDWFNNLIGGSSARIKLKKHLGHHFYFWVQYDVGWVPRKAYSGMRDYATDVSKDQMIWCMTCKAHMVTILPRRKYVYILEEGGHG